MTHGTPETRQRLWNHIKKQSNNEPGEPVRALLFASNSLPIDKETAGYLVKNWCKRGLIDSNHAGTQVWLTQTGVQAESPESPAKA